VTVTLGRRRDAIEFTVSDDGVGLPREVDPEGSRPGRASTEL